MMHIDFFTKENCTLCEEALVLLDMLKLDYPHTLVIKDIYSNDEWLDKYHLSIPVIKVNDKELNCEEISYDSVETLLKEAYNKRIT